jgi:hypothetical protein
MAISTAILLTVLALVGLGVLSILLVAAISPILMLLG